MVSSGTLHRTGDVGSALPSSKSGRRDRGLMSVVRRLGAAVAGIFTLVWLCLVLTQADEQLYVAGLLPLRPLIAYVPLVGMFLILVVLTLGPRSTVAEIATLTRCNLPVLLPFLALTSVALLWSQMRNAYWYDGGKYIYLYAYNFAVFLSALTIPMLPVFRRSWRVYLGAALLALVASIYYDILFPGTFTTLRLRAAGFPQNANFSAFFATILCASIVRYGRVQALEILIICVTAVAVVATFSRGGLLAFCLFLGVYVFSAARRLDRSQLRQMPRREVLAIVAALLVGGIAVAGGLQYLLANPVSDRLTSEEFIADSSAQSRLALAMETIELIRQAPLVGHGTAFTHFGDWNRPHNVYLTLWAELGLLGIGSYLALLYGAFQTFWRRGFIPGQVVTMVGALHGLFGQELLEQKPFVMLLGILLSLSYMEARRSLRRRPRRRRSGTERKRARGDRSHVGAS